MADGSARDRWRGGWRVAFALALAGCGSKIEPPPPLTVTNVACFVPAGEPRDDVSGPIRAMAFNEYGPEMCQYALAKYLRDHPTTRIVDILPLEIPLSSERPPVAPTEPGTQELLVVHADRGPWARADELEIDIWPCQVSGNLEYGPRECNGALTEYLKFETLPALLIPINHLTEGKHVRAGTGTLLVVRKRRSNRAPAAGPRSGP